jgi:hypothetical protein
MRQRRRRISSIFAAVEEEDADKAREGGGAYLHHNLLVDSAMQCDNYCIMFIFLKFRDTQTHIELHF